MPVAFAFLTFLAALGVLLAERRGSQRGKWIAKPLAAVGFVATALATGALQTRYGALILAALLLSAAGDVALVPKGTGWPFRIGMLAFLLAHVAFVTAFAARAPFAPDALLRVMIGLGLCIGFGSPLVRRAPPRLRIPVMAYALAVSSMASAAAVSGSTHIAAAGVLFLASDVFVALHRFTTPRYLWKVLAVPLYYGAQIVFATSVR
jgi:uncharacterized membrane protein YhhN